MIKNNLTKLLLSAINIETKNTTSQTSDETQDLEDEEVNGQVQTLLTLLLAKAGKSKDDVVKIIAKEIGQAIAAMLKEPLKKVAEHQQLKVTIELSPKSKSPSTNKTKKVKKSVAKRKK